MDTSVAIKKKTTKDKKSTVDEKVSGRKRTKKLGSKDESLDRLKKYVYLCGVRRIWKRELEGLDYKGAKIHIEEILRDLGVEGRPTIEKCKNICKKREYEQELTSIDANNIINSRLRSRTSDSLEEISPLSTHQESSEYESGPQKRKPRINLLAFGDPEED